MPSRQRRSKSGRRKKSKSVKRQSVRRRVRLRGGLEQASTQINPEPTALPASEPPPHGNEKFKLKEKIVLSKYLLKIKALDAPRKIGLHALIDEMETTFKNKDSSNADFEDSLKKFDDFFTKEEKEKIEIELRQQLKKLGLYAAGALGVGALAIHQYNKK